MKIGVNITKKRGFKLIGNWLCDVCGLELQSVGNRVGVQEPFLMRMAHGGPTRTFDKSKRDIKGLGVSTNKNLTHDQMLRVCKRFYVALILSRLVQVAIMLYHYSFIFYTQSATLFFDIFWRYL